MFKTDHGFFFSGLSFKDLVVSEGACDTRHVWILSIVGTRLMDHSIDSVYLYVYQFSLDLAGCPRTITDTKKPAGPALCGLLGLYWMTLVITNREIWAGIPVILFAII